MQKLSIAALVCFGALAFAAPSQAAPLSAAGALGNDTTRSALNNTTTNEAATPVRYRGRHYGWYRGHHYGWYRPRYGYAPRYYGPRRYGYYGPRYYGPRYYGYGYGPGIRFYW